MYSERNEKAVKRPTPIVGYFLAGYPSREDFLQLIIDLDHTALDILEIGYPSQNPYADGDVISTAHQMVDMSVQDDLGYWKQVRNRSSKPIWLMAYRDDFITSKIYQQFAEHQLMDGLVIPDCSQEEHRLLQDELADKGIDVLSFIKPTMSAKEIRTILSQSGLVYAQLYDGPTGNGDVKLDYSTMLAGVLEHKETVVFAGFGINARRHVEALIEEGFSGAVIGTEMIKKLNLSKKDLMDYINGLKVEVVPWTT